MLQCASEHMRGHLSSLNSLLIIGFNVEFSLASKTEHLCETVNHMEQQVETGPPQEESMWCPLQGTYTALE